MEKDLKLTLKESKEKEDIEERSFINENNHIDKERRGILGEKI